ncbi:MAG: hypothetical protein COX77_01840 [Candidatus Komeilibacteria bacterium CG_4_10_14_0_2_um_filter_37_10]|uniref:DUF3784 domain-containing protein n=1 Tax=Candidatus Komeilibacteria bacterium CG_4_10_14_0_2_um_filter_37_10 TaxID=1974470 RepID=A0A2M7VFF5_9BACT|nr:MAG: hypothetical protein COX77_01840 [Candidatus Komeilibacteria bacterium CG_4_10_14_0_2_um_filter_37_10]
MNYIFLIMGCVFLLLSWLMRSRLLAFDTFPNEEQIMKQVKRQLDYYTQLIFWLGLITIAFSVVVYWWPILVYWWPLFILLYYLIYYLYHSKK